MRRRMTTEEFIEKAKIVHGSKYDYSKVEYISSHDKVCIVCPEHGDFWQSPNNHLRGKSCPKCQGLYRRNTAEFIEDAKKIHGDKYDYSKVNYTNNSTKVCIICPIHGEFLQTPAKHLNGRGCPHKDCKDAKREQTNLERYGVTNGAQADISKEKFRQTCLDRYGVENVMQNEDVKENLRQTVRETYGVDYTCEAESVKAKRLETCNQKYGGNSPMCSDAVKEKFHDTMQERYGVINALESPILMNKAQQTFLEHYGVKNPMQAVQVREKQIDTKRENQTFNTSKSEETLYQMLCETFGPDDVIRQYRSDKYPFACDFYIKSRDLYLELNAFWTHGGHWYRKDSVHDYEILQSWRKKHTSFYDNAVSVWSQSDGYKRNQAAISNLNYVVFWDTFLRDAELWFALGCPDGQDWLYEYSWLEN